MTLKSSYGISKMTIISLNDQNEHVTAICAHIWLDDHYYDILTAICRHSLMENLAWVVLIVFQFWVLTYSFDIQRDQQQLIISQSLYTNNKLISWKSISFKFWASTVSTGTSLWSLYIMLGYVSQQVYSTWCSKALASVLNFWILISLCLITRPCQLCKLHKL